jgi:hypothetical protein
LTRAAIVSSRLVNGHGHIPEERAARRGEGEKKSEKSRTKRKNGQNYFFKHIRVAQEEPWSAIQTKRGNRRAEFEERVENGAPVLGQRVNCRKRMKIKGIYQLRKKRTIEALVDGVKKVLTGGDVLQELISVVLRKAVVDDENPAQIHDFRLPIEIT